MFKPSAGTTVVVPYREGPVRELGPVVNDAYFGKVPADRLVARDGRPLLQRRRPVPEQDRPLAAARAARPRQLRRRRAGVLTIVTFDRPEGAADYVNSMWEIQKEPVRGRRREQLQRRPARPGREAARARSTSSRPPRPRPPSPRATASPTSTGPSTSRAGRRTSTRWRGACWGGPRAGEARRSRPTGDRIPAVRPPAPRLRLALAGGRPARPRPQAPAADRTVLAIGAHAGDAEITAGAILARHKRLGDRVVDAAPDPRRGRQPEAEPGGLRRAEEARGPRRGAGARGGGALRPLEGRRAARHRGGRALSWPT